MKIAVIGCGSMGCYFGAKLSVKNEVVYIDTFQKTVDALNQNGITIIDNQTSTNVKELSTEEEKKQFKKDFLFIKKYINQPPIDELLEMKSFKKRISSVYKKILPKQK